MGAIDDKFALLIGDCREQMRTLQPGIARTCVTSPPYWGLRDYGVTGQLGAEPTPEEFVANLVDVFREVRRLLTDDGTLWLNLGDSYSNIGKSGGSSSGKHARGLHGDHQSSSRVHGGHIDGLKPKDLVGIPWMVAFALRADGWYLRSDVIWHKPNPMPESVTDRPTKSHEHLFLLAKSERYYYDADAIREPFVGTSTHDRTGGKHAAPGQTPHSRDGAYRSTVKADGRNKRDVWTVTPQPFKGAHFATMPPALVEPCVLAGSAPGNVVLDPFSGAGTTGLVAVRNGRLFVGTELNPEYADIAIKRWSEAA